VARCAICDKLAPGKWKKFYNGGWSEPGLGGKASYVQAYNVIYSCGFGKYVSFNYGGGLSVCSDLSKQDWTPSFRIPGACWGCNDIWAFTLADAGKTDVSRFERTMYVYTYWHLKPGSVYRVDFGEGETPNTFGYTGVGLAAPVIANTMNPIRPYGEPLYDNADTIESRRVRKVSCDSPEMSYAGDWAGQSSPVKARTSGTTGSAVAFVFKGSGVCWRAVAGPDCGKADVYLDEVFQKTVDLHGDFTPYQFGFVKTGLDAAAAHAIKIVVRGDKNPRSSGTAVKHISIEYSADSCQASDGFCSVMGKNNWYYQQWDGKNYSDLAFNAPDENTPYNYWLGAGNTGIGNDYQVADINDPVRKWLAPHDGQVRIEGAVTLEEGSGQRASVKIMRNDSEIWPARTVSDEKKEVHDITVSVNKDDAICFVVKRIDKTKQVKASWDPVITYI